jgi:hypothetical protein
MTHETSTGIPCQDRAPAWIHLPKSVDVPLCAALAYRFSQRLLRIQRQRDGIMSLNLPTLLRLCRALNPDEAPRSDTAPGADPASPTGPPSKRDREVPSKRTEDSIR